jgi:uncharacterized protein YhaN
MRILELYLKAFGPFTEQRLGLADREGGTGFCVVFGPNEAGKSSALRAIHDLLYGIPARSPDDFVHRYAELRVGARLRFSDGEELAFLRRKGAKDTLRSYDDTEKLAEGRLAELTRLVPEPVFASFYGLDHEGLSSGSEALLEDEGELGRSLYSAGLGSGNLRSLLDGLREEAEALYAPRAKKPRINEGLAQLASLQSRLRQESLKPQAWQEAEEAEREAEQRLAALDSELEQARALQSRLRRVRHTLPALARRRRCLERREAIPCVPDLDHDFEERLQELRARHQRAKDALEAARRRRGELETRRAELVLDPAILEERDAIVRLRGEWGAVSKEEADLPRREAELERLSRDFAARLAAIDPHARANTLDRLREGASHAQQIRELADRHAGQDASLLAALEEKERVAERLERIAHELALLGGPSDVTRLRSAVAEAERLGPIDGRIVEMSRDLEAARKQSDRAFEGLGRWAGPPEALERAVLPDDGVIERFDRRALALDRRGEEMAARDAENESERRRAREELDALREERAVPSEDDLARLREARDALWAGLRGRGSAEGGSSVSLEFEAGQAEEYEASVAVADDTADRLRREAGRVAKQAALVARLTALDSAKEANRRSRADLEDEVARHAEDWASLWSSPGLEPGSPGEMIAWRRGLERWLALVEQRRAAAAAWEREVALRGEALRALRAALAERDQVTDERGDERLAAWLADGRAWLEACDAKDARRRRLVEDRRAAEQEREEVMRRQRRSETLLGQWRDEWRIAVEGLCFSKEPRPSEALDRLEAVRELFGVQRERDHLGDRIAKMRSDIERFDESLAEFARRVVFALDAEAGPEPCLRALEARLKEAEGQDALRNQLEQSLEQAEEACLDTELALRSLAQQLDRLREQAGASTDEELDAVLRTWREVLELDREQAEAEEALLHAGDGLSFDQLEAEARAVDPDALGGRIGELEVEIARLVAERDRLRDELRTASDHLQGMNGGAEMALLAAEAEQTRASIRAEVDRYLVVRLAREILEREIERYRREHQDPVLTRAREIFEGLTLGAYPGLEVEEDEQGRAQVVARARSGRVARVAGLSTGTRDQLFLSLRLATIEDSLERFESMPLITDDILVHFDDERSAATLEALARLGERAQVLLFTHHRHVREQAAALGSRTRVLDLGSAQA